MFRGEWIDKNTNDLQSFPNSKRALFFVSQPCVFWREYMSSFLKLAGPQKDPFSPVPDIVQLLNGQKAASFTFFLVVIPVFCYSSCYSWLFVQVLLGSIPQIHSSRLFSVLHLCTQPSPSTSCPHSASQVTAASKISKTEEGVNEWPTVTSEVICSTKERGFYAVCASYTEGDRHHSNKLVRQEQMNYHWGHH